MSHLLVFLIVNVYITYYALLFFLELFTCNNLIHGLHFLGVANWCAVCILMFIAIENSAIFEKKSVSTRNMNAIEHLPTI